jgi:Icc-related predicted phosphoesterase
MLQVYSDLHTEFGGFTPNVHPETKYIILAGDIGVGDSALDWVESLAKQYLDKHIIYVAGNHEYYGSSVDQFDKSAVTRFLTNTNVHFLQNGRTKVFHDTRHVFIGATLWTSMQDRNPLVMQIAQETINDFKHIVDFTAEESVRTHRNHLKEIIKSIKCYGYEDYSTVVVSHHAPSYLSSSSEYKGDLLNAAFLSDLSEEILTYRPSLWIHGHLHTSSDYILGGTRIICNPLGYQGRQINKDFLDAPLTM